MTDPIEILVNGEPRQVPADATVRDLLEMLGMRAERIAVERNRSLVPRSAYGQVRLEPADRLEIVTFVGGG